MERFLNDSIADTALGGVNKSAVSQVKKVTAPVVKKAVETPSDTPRRYLEGFYRSDRFMRIIKELTFEHAKDENGKVRKTHGTWSKASNMIIFQKGVETQLTDADLTLPAVRSLIDRKIIFKVG